MIELYARRVVGWAISSHPDSACALREAVEQILSDEYLRKSLEMNAKSDTAQRFTLETI